MVMAVIGGSVGVLAVLYALNEGVEKLPPKWRSRLLPWVYVGPGLLLLCGYLLLPMLYTLYLSFWDGRSQQFVGLANYGFLFTQEEMGIALRNNLLWLLGVTSFSVGLGLGLAVLLERVRYANLIKGAIVLPMAISCVGASVIWRFVYAYRPAGSPQIGLLNAIATHLGRSPVGWLVETCLPLVDGGPLPLGPLGEWNCWGIPALNTLALIVVMIWLQTGFCMVLLSAAVKAVPQELVEAARLDGANDLQIFGRIVLPLLRPTLRVVTTTVMIVVLKVFDIVWVMTGGNQDTDVLASRMIKEMFNFRNFGRGSAIAVVLFIAVGPFVLHQLRQLREVRQ